MRPRKQVLEIGMRFGHLTIARDLGPNKYRQTEYECRCDCGEFARLRTSHFTPTRLHCSRSCSLLREKKMANLIGQQFGAWVVREEAGKDNGAKWRCVCICGKEQVIETYVLQGGHSDALPMNKGVCIYRRQNGSIENARFHATPPTNIQGGGKRRKSNMRRSWNGRRHHG